MNILLVISTCPYYYYYYIKLDNIYLSLVLNDDINVLLIHEAIVIPNEPGHPELY